MRYAQWVAMLFLLGTTVALAQTTSPAPTAVITVNDLLVPWIPVIMIVVGAVVTIILEFIRQYVKRKTDMDISNAHMLTLQTAVENAAGLALTKLSQQAKQVEINTRSPQIAQAVLYVNQSAADAVNSFGLTKEQIAEKVIAKMGVITAPNPDFVVQDTTPPPPNPGQGG